VDIYQRFDHETPQHTEYNIYYSADSDRLSAQRQKVRRGLYLSGLENYGFKDGKNIWSGHRSGDPPNANIDVLVSDISEIEIIDVSDTEDSVLESGMIEQIYFVDRDNDGNDHDRLILEQSLDADGRNTNEIHEIPR
jgi:hypothetical protein